MALSFGKVFDRDPVISDRARSVLIGILVVDVVLFLLWFSAMAYMMMMMMASYGDEIPSTANPWPAIGYSIFAALFLVAMFNVVACYLVSIFVYSHVVAITMKRSIHVAVCTFIVLTGLVVLDRW